MKTCYKLWLALASLSCYAIAGEVQITQREQDRQQCNGMYSKSAWGGDVDPFILTKFVKITPEGDEDPLVSLVVFEWRDEDLVGRWPSDDAPKVCKLVKVEEFGFNSVNVQKVFICDDPAVNDQFCDSAHLGEFVLSPNVTEAAKNPVLTKSVHLNNPEPLNYPVTKTGYYCVGTFGYSAKEYKAVVEFRNAYGELQAAQIAKLPFYGGLTIVYAVMGIFWAFLYVQNRHDILPVQNYITAIIVFLIVEQLMTWGFYDYSNNHGNNIGAKILMILVAILNAGRNSFSFFLLLIVCMGYGVVKPSLGKTMWYVRILALCHFVFGVIYAVASLTITPDNAGPLVLLVILPLAATLTAFYVWTLNSLNFTMKDLLERKQSVKAMMYKKLWWCILSSIIIIFAFFFLNSFSFAGRRDPDFVPDHWKTRWFILDGWLNLVYLVDIAFVAYLWRPTANNRRFAMSDELAQDDEGFEIASFGGSLDEEDARSPGAVHEGGPLSPVPPKPVSEGHPARQSLDGETIFAVGEDADKWSDDDNSPRNSAERTKLTGKDR